MTSQPSRSVSPPVWDSSASDVEIQAANLIATLDRLRRIISTHTGHPLEEVIDDVGRDRWFDADQALEYGFVDHVVTHIDQILPARAIREIGVSRTREVAA